MLITMDCEPNSWFHFLSSTPYKYSPVIILCQTMSSLGDNCSEFAGKRKCFETFLLIMIWSSSVLSRSTLPHCCSRIPCLCYFQSYQRANRQLSYQCQIIQDLESKAEAVNAKWLTPLSRFLSISLPTCLSLSHTPFLSPSLSVAVFLRNQSMHHWLPNPKSDRWIR